MSKYAQYKNWWIEHQAPHEPRVHFRDTPETQFEQHINTLSLYELMEKLELFAEKE